MCKVQGKVRRGKCVCLLLMWIAFVVGAASCCYAMLCYHSTLAILLLLPLIALGIPPLFAFFSVAVFPLPYSALGRLARSPPPSGQQPLIVLRSSWIRTPYFIQTCPGVTWVIFRGGLGISIELIGRVFLPSESIVSIEYNRQGHCVITHTCKELRTPILGPGKLAVAIKDSWEFPD
jgi:hypothetical protein